MSNSLQLTIQGLASQFAEQLLKEIRGLSLEEILAMTPKHGGPSLANGSKRPSAAGGQTANGRLARRSAEEIAATADQIVALLRQHRVGLRAEQIQKELGLDKKEMPRPVAHALSTRKISKKGEKRATTYFAR